MSLSTASIAELLRPGLLRDVAVLLAAPSQAPAGGGLAAEVAAACETLGARLSSCPLGPDPLDPAQDAALDVAVQESGGVDLLVLDGAGLFAAGLARGAGGHRALRACLDGAWSATRAVVNHAFLQAAEPRGRIVYLAPAPDAGEYAEAARAGLENLARTLSIEWARHAITTTTIAPRAASETREVATLVAYLASPAGAYFSGSLLDLRGPRPA